MPLKTTILLGAGASIDAGAASTGEITEAVLRECDFVKHTDSTFGPPGGTLLPGQRERVKAALEFLHLLNGYIEAYYDGTSRAVNYEDLYYVARQVADSESWEYDNPVAGFRNVSMGLRHVGFAFREAPVVLWSR